MGRVLETYGGSNVLVRVVKLNTVSGESDRAIIRPASKIASLESNLD